MPSKESSGSLIIGGPTELGGSSWTAADINRGDFGLEGASSGFERSVTAKVYYTLPSGSGTTSIPDCRSPLYSQYGIYEYQLQNGEIVCQSSTPLICDAYSYKGLDQRGMTCLYRKAQT